MSKNHEENESLKKGAGFTGVGAAVGTTIAAVAGTTFAAPMAIGAGVGLAIWGIVELTKGSK